MRTKTLCEATLFIFSCANLGNLGCLMNLLFYSFTFCCETSKLVTLRKVRFGFLRIVNLSAFLLFDTVGRTAGLRWQKKNLTLCLFGFFSLQHLLGENILTLGLLECQAESLSVCFEPHFDTLTLKKQLHKFTLCQINQQIPLAEEVVQCST